MECHKGFLNVAHMDLSAHFMKVSQNFLQRAVNRKKKNATPPGERIDSDRVFFVRGHDKPRLMGMAIAIDPFQVV